MSKKSTAWSMSEDSGFNSASISVSDILSESTPVNEKNKNSRKRKIPLAFDRYASPNIASSTFNESAITKSLELCNISSLSPNFYIEHNDLPKRPCSDPGTPPKNEPTEFYKLHTDSFQRTPTKIEPFVKLGSPERNKILYGELKSNSKLNSPMFKRTPSVKKCLFYQRNGVDFIKGLRDRGCLDILERILLVLDDCDLYRCKSVSKSWETILMENDKIRGRISNYKNRRLMNKENCFRRQSNGDTSLQMSPKKGGLDDFIKLGRTLKEGQRLDKCPVCTNPTVIENNIGQCQHYNCGYIYCLSCSSCSTTGPENFTDSCMQSSLIIEKPLNKSNLSDRSIKSDNSLPSFLCTTPKKYESPSFTETSLSPIINTSFNKRRGSILGDYNRELPRIQPSLPRRNTVVPVISLKPRNIEVIEPSSPPKIKNVACSAASRKNLKRLLRH